MKTRTLHRLSLITITLLISISLYLIILSEPLPLRVIPASLENVVYSHPKSLIALELKGTDGDNYDVNHFYGRWSLLFFGYTYCPDICPIALTIMNGVIKSHQSQSPGSIQYLFASVDPKRDNFQHLKDYVGYFHPLMVGLSGNSSQIDQLVNQVGATYLIDGDSSSDNYLVHHSASMYLISPKGEIIAHFVPPHQINEIVSQLDQIIKLFTRYKNG